MKKYYIPSTLTSRKVIPQSMSLLITFPIHESFENENCPLGVIIDLFKAFVTIDHAVILKILTIL